MPPVPRLPDVVEHVDESLRVSSLETRARVLELVGVVVAPVGSSLIAPVMHRLAVRDMTRDESIVLGSGVSVGVARAR